MMTGVRKIALLVCIGIVVAVTPALAQETTVNRELLLDVIENWHNGNGETSFSSDYDVLQNGYIDADDLLLIIRQYPTKALPTPRPYPTDTPTGEAQATATPTATTTPTEVETQGETATPTDTQGAPSTYDIGDYFPLALDSQWHYVEATETPGASPEDDFTWTIDASGDNAYKDIDGSQVTRIKTTTDEPTDDRNLDEDYWRLEDDGTLNYYGFYNGQEDTISLGSTDAAFPVQDIILSAPVEFGHAGMQIGDVVTDTASVTVQLGSPLNTALSGVVNSTITHEAFTTVTTPLDTFTNVLQVRVDIVATVDLGFFGSYDYVMRDSRFYLARDIGLVQQVQKPDTTDAENQVITTARVGGQDIAGGSQ